MNNLDLWNRYRKHLCTVEGIDLRLDISRMGFDDAFFDEMTDPMARVFDAMDRIESGVKANIDEDRMVGHYWLRAPALAPNRELTTEIERTIDSIKEFADGVHSETLKPQRGDGFYVVLVVGVGGSALGPQFVADALGTTDDPMIVRFIDNTDPDGMDRTLGEINEALDQTLTIVISKSGGTVETRNGMLEAAAAYKRAGLDFAKHAVAITCDGSKLHKQATDEQWLATFPMWDWVGGRTSVLSGVGLLPAALQGFDIDGLLAGARECDEATRLHDVKRNPAALLAVLWHYAGGGQGRRNMVVIPYRDRLSLFSLYLQQLVMESLGKRLDRGGEVVHQGLTVYGRKGSSDQHAYVQQLRDGLNDFFVTFIDVLDNRKGGSLKVEEDVTAGDYLSGFLQGTRTALFESGRESMTLTLRELSARGVGALIALFERAVGLYAELINVNAYDQPGVEAGKKAAGVVIDLQRKVLAHLRDRPRQAQTAEQIASAIGAAEDVETVFHVLEHAAANEDHGITRIAGTDPFNAQYVTG